MTWDIRSLRSWLMHCDMQEQGKKLYGLFLKSYVVQRAKHDLYRCLPVQDCYHAVFVLHSAIVVPAGGGLHSRGPLGFCQPLETLSRVLVFGVVTVASPRAALASSRLLWRILSTLQFFWGPALMLKAHLVGCQPLSLCADASLFLKFKGNRRRAARKTST